MSLALSTDHNIKRESVTGLRQRHVNVLTAAEDGAEQMDDQHVLERATQLARILCSEDKDFFRITLR